MHVRVVACLSTLCLGVGVTQAAAAVHRPAKRPVKPVCNLVSDPGDDAPNDPTAGLAKGPWPQDPAADILSADIASDATNLTAVIRVASVTGSPTAWPGAHSYTFQWNVPGHDTPVMLSGTVDPNPAAGVAFGPQFTFGDLATTGGVFTASNTDFAAKVKGTVDAAKNTITMSVPISQLSGFGTFTPGAKFTGLTASSQDVLNGPDLPANAPLFGGSLGFGVSAPDTDTTKAVYVAGTRSCVTPGS